MQINLSDETANLVKAEALRLSEEYLKYFSESEVVEWIVLTSLGNPDEADRCFLAGVDRRAVQRKMDTEITARQNPAPRLTNTAPTEVEQRILREEADILSEEIW